MKKENEKLSIRQRTKNQNSALHLYFTQIAEALNKEGYDVRLVLQVISEKGVDMFWSGELVKELLWRKIQLKHLNKRSTTELNSIGEIEKIYEMLNRFIGENFFIHVPFPSIETLIEKDNDTRTQK